LLGERCSPSHLQRRSLAVVEDVTVAHLRTVGRDGDHIAGLVHIDNL